MPRPPACCLKSAAISSQRATVRQRSSPAQLHTTTGPPSSGSAGSTRFTRLHIVPATSACLGKAWLTGPPRSRWIRKKPAGQHSTRGRDDSGAHRGASPTDPSSRIGKPRRRTRATGAQSPHGSPPPSRRSGAIKPLRHYRDDSDLEVDAVVEQMDGSWGAFEVKVGMDKAGAGVGQEAPPLHCGAGTHPDVCAAIRRTTRSARIAQVGSHVGLASDQVAPICSAHGRGSSRRRRHGRGTCRSPQRSSPWRRKARPACCRRRRGPQCARHAHRARSWSRRPRDRP